MKRLTDISTKVRRISTYAANDLRCALGMNRRFFRESAGARVIAYHGVCLSDATRFNTLFLRLSTFERHLQFYRKYFHVISLDDYFKGKFVKDRFNVCLTFDDGFANNYRYVLPLLQKYATPAAFFVTGIRDAGYDFLWNDYLAFLQKYGPREIQFGGNRYRKDKCNRYISPNGGASLRAFLQEGNFDNKERLIRQLEPIFPLTGRMNEKDFWMQMTGEEIGTLAASPFATIGCHGYTHCDLARMPAAEAREEMARGRIYLENIIQKKIDAFAFPYGSYTRDVVAGARSAGFDRLLALDFLFPEDHSDPAMCERIGVNPYISVNNQMDVIINGRYSI